MAMVISTRAKLVITALILFFLLGIVLVTGSTKGWFNPNRYNGERVAARIQGGEKKHNRSKNTDICESFIHGLGI
ncbi:GD13985 [Drosophila simulans]|uniref:GD13985 n=1 Tax=Drosophila simulans TaxID=7240 RepID=B4QJW3_DROSI|nr:GD13985 [Drosophila simulans]